jgi:co-chaperonin GroES (HSP10)
VTNKHVTSDGLKVRVLGNNLLVRPAPAPKESRGGIIIPDNVLGGLYLTGEVVAVGFLTTTKAPEHTPIPGIAVGDRVLFTRFLEKTDGNERIARVIGDDLIRIRPADVLLVMDGADAERLR